MNILTKQKSKEINKKQKQRKWSRILFITKPFVTILGLTILTLSMINCKSFDKKLLEEPVKEIRGYENYRLGVDLFDDYSIVIKNTFDYNQRDSTRDGEIFCTIYNKNDIGLGSTFLIMIPPYFPLLGIPYGYRWSTMEAEFILKPKDGKKIIKYKGSASAISFPALYWGTESPYREAQLKAFRKLLRNFIDTIEKENSK